MNDTANDTDHARRRSALAALLPDRLAGLSGGLGWRRVVLARRVAAGLLVLAAIVLAVRAPPEVVGGTPVVVAVHELASGATVRPGDVALRRWPAELVPTAALGAVEQAEGRVLAGAASFGEPLTSVRFAGAEGGRIAGGRDTASVPIRLADADVAGLLSPGRLVDVVTVGQRADQPTVLAAAATVLTVLPAEAKPAGRGRLVLIAVPRAAASKVAAATLSQEVTVTLR
ncbi:MAG TPA: SAF domain-containing protein [Pseudonocardia sp.]|nr:SAF domain-containing protein [Pseudonocardia sp.]